MIKNKNILITGGNSGIGLFAIINLLKTKNNLYVVIKSELRKNEFLKTIEKYFDKNHLSKYCLLYTSPSPRDRQKSRMPSSA